MNDRAEKEGGKVEPYDYGEDFQILTPKEKRVVLKNAKHLLKLQKDNVAVLADALPQKEI